MAIAFQSACFFSTNNGVTTQRRASAADENVHPLPASGITNLLRLDETQPNNAALLTAWVSNSTPFTMSGNSLLVSGQMAGIDPPGLLFEALENASALYAKAATTNDAFTREEQAQILAIGFHALGLV